MYGNAPAHELFERVQIKRRDDSKPLRQFADYAVTLDGKPVDAKVLQEVAVG